MALIRDKEKEIAKLKEQSDCPSSTSAQRDCGMIFSFYSIDTFLKEIKKLENEREQARIYAKELEMELKQTREDLYDNKVNLIEPLKNKLTDLENMIQSKEHKIKRNYRRKLRKYRRELQNEKKINMSLAKRISLFKPGDKSISDIDFEDDTHPLYTQNKKQCKSQLEINRSKSQFNQFHTHVDLKRYKQIRTLDSSIDADEKSQKPVPLTNVKSEDLDTYSLPRRQKSYHQPHFQACMYTFMICIDTDSLIKKDSNMQSQLYPYELKPVKYQHKYKNSKFVAEFI